MCGIAGIVDFRSRPIDRAGLERLCASMAHRGPDDHGAWIHESSGFSVGLVNTRLAIIDPTPEGHQPMVDPAGRYAVAYNGELYNYRTLRARLSGEFRTATDTEVVLRACAQHGPDALSDFDAMWALAFVDVAERRGHLSRDPFGIKPLYYVHHDGRLMFASELRTLRQLSTWPRDLDRGAVDVYLHLGFIPHPQSVYQHVHKLAPGHLLEFSAEGPRSPRRYYRLPPTQSAAIPYSDAVVEVRQRVERAVLSQRVADVPLGAFLSGGLDSSVVVACLARAGGERAKTFSIGYAEHASYDETGYAELVSKHFGTDHHAFRLTFADVLASVEPMINHLGEPFADSSLLPTALVSQHTRRSVTVALSGDGGDELFGGYWRYLAQHYLARYRRIPAWLRNRLIKPLLSALPSAKSNRWLNRVRQARKLLRGDNLHDPLARHLSWARYIDEPLATALMGGSRAHAASAAMLGTLSEGASLGTDYPRHDLGEVLLADLGVGLPADMLFKVDTASMFHSLEVRVPLLAKELVEYVAALPVDYRIHGNQGKRILKDAFRDILPAEILNRKKMGFEVPIGEFLRSELRDLFHDVVTPAALAEFALDPAPVRKIYQLHANRQEDYAEILWALLVLCRWRQNRD